jgi:glutaredoxin-related protein
MYDNPYPQDIIIAKLFPFPNKSKIVNAIEYQNPKIRILRLWQQPNILKKVKGYSDYRTIIQCFAVLKK